MIIKGRYYIQDIESGEYEEVSKSHYEQIMDLRRLMTAQVKGKHIGQVMIFGTGGETGLFSDIFYNPSGYKILDKDENFIHEEAGEFPKYFKPNKYDS